MNTKTSKAYNLQANKNNQMQKRTTKFELLASTTLKDAQPSCSLSPSAFHPWHFRVCTFHPSTKRNLTLFQRYNHLRATFDEKDANQSSKSLF
jgi:hypothetical protein